MGTLILYTHTGMYTHMYYLRFKPPKEINQGTI